MASLLLSREKCVIYRPETVLKQSHLIKLAISSIILIWQELLLIQVSLSYHKKFMPIASSLLQFSNNKVKKSKKSYTADHVVILFMCLFFVFDFW